MRESGLTELREPKPVGKLTNHEMLYGIAVSPIQRLKHFSAEQFEDFTLEWAHSLKIKYQRVVGGGGSGDKGRDVVAYKNTEKQIWDNYQCKHYEHPLRPSDVYVELGKLCYYTHIKEYTLPEKYFFISPRGPGQKLAKYLDTNPDLLKDELLKNWSTIAKKITQKEIKLDEKLRKHIESVDFSIFTYVPPMDLIEQHKQTPWHIFRFGGGLAKRPESEKPTKSILPSENRYINQLLEAYSDKEGFEIKNTKDLNKNSILKGHLLRQRESFFSAESLKKFSQDQVSLGSDPFADLKKEIFDGVVDLSEANYLNGFERLNTVTSEARKLPIHSNILKEHVELIDMQGICHHLANDDKLIWVQNKNNDTK